MNNLQVEIQQVINRYNAEAPSNTPDFILAEYLTDCLAAFDKAMQARNRFYAPTRTFERETDKALLHFADVVTDALACIHHVKDWSWEQVVEAEDRLKQALQPPPHRCEHSEGTTVCTICGA